MRLRWTVVVLPGSGGAPTSTGPSRIDVVVECPPGTSLAEVVTLVPAGAAAAPLRLDGATAVQVRVDGAHVAGGAQVGRAPLLDGAVLTVGPPAVELVTDAGDTRGATTAGSPIAPLLELVVRAGPDSGRSHPLRPGRLVCGRSAGCDITVRDPRLSRHHCELVLGVDGVTVVDLGSTNGTRVAGGTGRDDRSDRPGRDATSGPGVDAPVPRLLALGEDMHVGASLVTLRQVRSTRPALLPETGRGTRLVRRSPRARPQEQAPVIRLPAAARQSRTTAFPVLTVVLPALAAVGLAVWTGSTTYLVLAGLGPVLVAGGWYTARREARQDGRLGRSEHIRITTELTEQARAAAERLADAREVAMPGADTVLLQCMHPSGRLWERGLDDDDAFRVRVGRAATDVVAPATGTGPVPRGADGVDLAALLPRVALVSPDGGATSVPSAADLVSVDLREGALGVVEPGPDPSSTRFVVGQVVALLPPTAVGVTAVLGAAARARWGWLALLPHTVQGVAGDETLSSATPGAVARALAEVVARRGRAPDGAAARATHPSSLLVVIDDPDDEIDPADLSWLPRAHLVGVHVVVVAPAAARVPRGCAAVVVPTADDAVDVLVTRLVDGSTAVATADRVGAWWGDRVGRALAPLRPSSTGVGDPLPDEVRLDDLLDTRPQQVRRRWAQQVRGLPVPLGVGRAGVVTVDLTAAGPHALVAGTTGSGKSELLRTWLLGIAASRPPSEVAFLLVDYKGGATFDDLAVLPHTVGLLTDLDGGATTRVLHSLRAEVLRRERLLGTAGARDLDAYRSSPDSAEPLPRLLVVVDEFRILAEDAPEVLGEFVRLAATGRSLGMHLVLATQRPGGVVSADIRSNAGLRIALRVQDAAESRDVVDRPDAAWLPAGSPGRAVLVGPGLDETVQTAYAGSGSDTAVRLQVVHSSGAPVPAQGRAAAELGDLTGRTGGTPDALAGILEAARSSGVGPATSPWSPALPDVLHRPEQLGEQGPAGSLRLGETDLPWEQARGQLLWSPAADGPVLVLGGPRSGRTTTLETIARTASTRAVPVVRLSGEPGDAGEDGDPDHVVDTLEALADAAGVPARPEHEADGAGTAHDGPRRSSVPGLRVLLLLDDADPLLDPACDPAAVDLLSRLLRSGHRSGIGVALAGGRSLAGSRLAAAARLRLVHRMTDSTDAVVAGVPAAARELTPVPGRCAVLGLDGQQPPPGAWLQAQVFAPDPPRGRSAPAAPAPAWLPRTLPAAPTAADLPAPAAGRLPLGLVSPDSTPWAVDLNGRRLFTVAGPPGSGRTTALRLLARQGAAAGLRVGWALEGVLGGRGEPGPADAAGRAPDLPTQSRRTVRPPDPDGRTPTPSSPRRPTPGPRLGDAIPVARPAGGPTAVDLLLVDDVHHLGEAELAALEDWLTSGSGPLALRLGPGATVVVSGATDWFADAFRGLPAVVRRDGHGVVLSPSRTDVRDVLGARTTLQQRTRAPGRGLLVDRGRVVRIQIARPDTRVPPDEPPGHRSTQEPPASTTV